MSRKTQPLGDVVDCSRWVVSGAGVAEFIVVRAKLDINVISF
jgi:hypothetical protein